MDAVRHVTADLTRRWEELRVRLLLRYQPVASKERDATAAEGRVNPLRRVLLLAPKRLFLLVIVCILILTSILTFRRHDPPPPPPAPSEEPPGGLRGVSSGHHRFVIVLPTDGSSPDLCKVVTSALAMGYPMPVVVNWGANVHSTNGGSHLAKVKGTLAYLDELSNTGASEEDRLSDNDLVLIVDPYDIWFQLPPEVLLHRYHEANAWANDRLAKQWPDNAGEMPMKQTIIVSSQKRCYPPPETGFEPHCDAVPDSPLPIDTYGPNTDGDPAVNPGGYHDIRPKFVNSGTIMGPVSDVRRYFRRVLAKMDEMIATYEVPISSDQGIFSEVFGEQEVYRQWRRKTQSKSAEDPPAAVQLMDHGYEYHVGLDYYQNLAMTTAFAEDDGTFVVFENHTAIDAHSQALGISPTRLNGLPEDIKDVHHPLDNKLITHKFPSLAWANFSLYADFFTTSVPVILHHNGGAKERRVRWWDRTWFFPYLRELVKAQLMPQGQLKALARMHVQGGGDVVYWAPASDTARRLPRLHKLGSAGETLGTVKLDALCRYEDERDDKHWYDEVFRDGKGDI